MENNEHPSVMKELSDIKASLAVNTSETKNIKDSISEIKSDMRDIKSQFVTRGEYTDAHEDLKDRVAFLRNVLWGLVTTLVAIGVAFLRYIKF